MADPVLFVLFIGIVVTTALAIWKAPLITDEDMEWIRKNDPWFKDEE